jgi:RNA polymerase sigma-70 factor (ECF subfamily)
LREASRFLDSQLAQDAAQEAALRAWRHRHTQSGDSPDAWIRTIARREALRVIARRRATDPIGDADQPADEQSLEDLLVRLDVLNRLGCLSSEEKEAVLLSYWADATDQAIATRLGIPLGTVKVRLHRARSKLRAAAARDA